MNRYDHASIEKKWQTFWSEQESFITANDSNKPKYYVLDMFPYPSGVGLHVGHPKGYIATDVISRSKRMQGFNVLHPMGWDAFGLPAENYALKNKVHPSIAVKENVERFKEQLSVIGFDYDWSREVNTTDPNYYKWTQWAFIQMFNKGLAFESNEPINWCPSCKTGLANEDLEQGKCERCGSEVEQRPIRQWVLKITDYADRLLEGLDDLDWEDSMKDMQRNWIGRSEGAEIEFEIKDSEGTLNVFTTRPDTIFGATYMVIAPEHGLVHTLEDRIENLSEVKAYIEASQKKTELERTDLAKEKTGVELKGIKAINPANGEEIPVWIADYVLAGYGTGAIMAVPAHDERDHEFATKYNLKIKQVVEPLFSQNDKDKALEVIVSQLIELSNKNDKELIFSGGWAIDFFADQRIRNHDDIDICVSYEDATWWKEQLESNGFSQRDAHSSVPNKEYDQRYHLEMIKSDSKELLKVDIIAVGYDDNDIIYDMEWGSPDSWDFSKAEAITDVVFNDKPLKIFSKKVQQWLKIYDRDKDQIDKLVLGMSSWSGDGIAVNSDFLDGLSVADAKEKINTWLEKEGHGKGAVSYRLKDWVFSRQRYWGEPIPIIHCEKCGPVAVPEDQLPVVLPDVEKYEPTDTGESPLANITDWVNTSCPECGGEGKRETNTMPQWAGSCWYYLRYIDPTNDSSLVDAEKEKYMSPVDLYVGGAEHATRHLIYARFWHKFLFDIGTVGYDEPFTKLQHVGLIMAEDGRKMSKRWGNVINPDEIVENYGADSLRVYEMFMGPFDQAVSWNSKSIIGVRKFLERTWKLQDKMQENHTDSEAVQRETHKTIKKVTNDIEKLRFNTAISQMMVLVNTLTKEETISKEAYSSLVLVLSPFAPHIAEELWNMLGNTNSLSQTEWPSYDEKLAKDDEIELVIQINGKVRDRVMVAADISEEDAKATSLASEKVKTFLDGNEPKKMIFIQGKLMNIVI